jgi:hypothetical protein
MDRQIAMRLKIVLFALLAATISPHLDDAA